MQPNIQTKTTIPRSRLGEGTLKTATNKENQNNQKKEGHQ
jgi:hypothetical protein